MLDFETICYLENPKTGSTYVVEFLRTFCADRLLRFHKHAMVPVAKDKFYFLNVREPLDLYQSLYSFGLDGRGGVYTRLARAGHGGLYEHGPAGFEPWMEFVLDDAHSPLLDPTSPSRPGAGSASSPIGSCVSPHPSSHASRAPFRATSWTPTKRSRSSMPWCATSR